MINGDKPSNEFRLNQAIAKTGFCSRRRADYLIESGQVTVNGKIVRDFATTVNPHQDVLKVGKVILAFKPYEYILLYKPRGIVTTCLDERKRANVLSLLPPELQFVKPVGRLDMYSEGLLILTNDGKLTQLLTHPSYKLYKNYQVTIRGYLANRDLTQLANGLMLDGKKTAPAIVKLLSRNTQQSTFNLQIYEGRNRQIRRMCEKLGYSVSRLVRISIGALQLNALAPGSWRHLTPKEIQQLESV